MTRALQRKGKASILSTIRVSPASCSSMCRKLCFGRVDQRVENTREYESDGLSYPLAPTRDQSKSYHVAGFLPPARHFNCRLTRYDSVVHSLHPHPHPHPRSPTNPQISSQIADLISKGGSLLWFHTSESPLDYFMKPRFVTSLHTS